MNLGKYIIVTSIHWWAIGKNTSCGKGDRFCLVWLCMLSPENQCCRLLPAHLNHSWPPFVPEWPFLLFSLEFVHIRFKCQVFINYIPQLICSVKYLSPNVWLVEGVPHVRQLTSQDQLFSEQEASGCHVLGQLSLC